jgi:hypothetical protein
MPYTVLLAFTIQLVLLPLNPALTTSVENRVHDLEGDSFHKQVSVQSNPVLLVLQDQTSSREKQQSDQSQKETTETKKKQYTPPQKKDKKSSSKDFVPSEKIKADKAVDFPADI